MMPHTSSSNEDRASLWHAWRDASKTTTIDQALRAFYRDLDAAVANAPQQPVCNASGRCCKFNTYDHLLYVTGLEIAWFLSQVASSPHGNVRGHQGLSLKQLPDACRYQIDGMCSTHAVRPLGCRVYFCQEGTQDWQQENYEAFLDRLIKLHKTHGIEYRYMEWRSGLIEADQHLAQNLGPGKE